MSKFQSFVDEHVTKKSKDGIIKISSAINKRWETRVVIQGLDKQGAAGAQAYLARYGKNIAAPKVIDLALCAQAKGVQEMATAFWVKAYEFTFGSIPVDVSDTVVAVISSISPKVAELPVIDELPDNLQPGKIHTMQAVDAPKDREFYINNPLYLGQPKRDGHRIVVIATPNEVYFQTRNMNLIDISDIALINFFKEAVRKFGTFILDGELWYGSFDGKEHRTAAQAAEWNIKEGQEADIFTIYTIFTILFYLGNDLTRDSANSRFVTLNKIEWPIISADFEVCPTAFTMEQKRALTKKQKTEEREGKVWINMNTHYIGGKTKAGYPMVRTKHLSTDIFICTGVTPTTAENRLFGALEISEQQADGKLIPVGKVGTGFDAAAQKMLMAKADRGKFYVVVEYQGRTAAGKLMHARYKDPSNDK